MTGPLLTFDDVTFSYLGSGTPALRGLSLDLSPGDMVALLGPQGSGTSTACRLAAGLLEDRGTLSGQITRPESGTALLGDDPEAQLTGMASFAADEVRLPGRLHGLSPGVIAARAEEAMQALGISHLARRRLETLSGGERQLTALAGLLTLRSPLLILDQPALALDAAARERLVTVLRAHCSAGGAVIVASPQYDDVTAGCDREILLGPPSTIWSTVSLAQMSAAQPVAPSPPETPQHPQAPGLGSASTAALNVRGLGVRRGGHQILNGVDLALQRGQVAAVLGPNGSGKSTLLRAMAGLLRGRRTGAELSGTVSVGGEDLSAVPAHRRAHRVAWVGQDPGAQISAASVTRELERALPKSGHGQRRRPRTPNPAAIVDVLQRTGLDDVASEHPYDLAPSRRKDLVIATGLLLGPEVLLLDEPTLGRDAAAMAQLNRVIAEFTATGGVVVLSTHDRAWARGIAQRVLELDTWPPPVPAG